jgi:hypothetical protein
VPESEQNGTYKFAPVETFTHTYSPSVKVTLFIFFPEQKQVVLVVWDGVRRKYGLWEPNMYTVRVRAKDDVRNQTAA